MLRYLRNGQQRTKTIWWVLIVVTSSLSSEIRLSVWRRVRLHAAGPGDRRGGNGQTARPSVAANTSPYWPSASQYLRQYSQGQPSEQDERVIEVQHGGLVLQRLMGDQARPRGSGHRPRGGAGHADQPPACWSPPRPFRRWEVRSDSTRRRCATPTTTGPRSSASSARSSRCASLQERLIGSLKIAERSCARRSATVREGHGYHPAGSRLGQRHPHPAATGRRPPSHYEQYRVDRLGARTQLEVLSVQRRLGDEEVRAAHEMAPDW